MKILITGAAGGMGYLSALTLAQRGHDVYLTCHNVNQVKSIKDKVSDYSNINVLKIDITKEEDRQKVLDLNVDCLISNAAEGQGGSLLEAKDEHIKKSFDVNVFSNFKLTVEVLKQMIDRDSGKVIMISSLIAKVPVPFAGIYSATKACVSNFTHALRDELWLMGSNVQITLIEPGLYHTGFNQVLLDNKYDKGEYFKDIRKEIRNVERFLFRIFEKKELDTIVVKIVRAVEDKKTKRVYRAPFFEEKLIRLYSMFK